MDTDDAVNNLRCADENQHQEQVASTNIPVTNNDGDEEKTSIVESLSTITVGGTSTVAAAASASTPIAVEKLRTVGETVSVPAGEFTTSCSTNDAPNSAYSTNFTSDLGRSAVGKSALDSNEKVTVSNPIITTTTSTATTTASISNSTADTETKANSITPITISRGTGGSFQPDPAFKDPITGLSMSTGAIRARQRRAKEREEKLKERQRIEILKSTGGTKQGNSSNNTPATSSEPTMPLIVSNRKAVEDEATNVQELSIADNNLVLIGNGPAVVESENNYCTNPLAVRLNALHQQRRQQQQLHRDANVRLNKRRHYKSPKATHQQQLAASSTASSGPSSLIASKLPLAFPPQEAFRALSLYATLRTFSLQLRLSPFTPNSFLLGLSCPFITRLIGEVHVALLRLLFLNIGRGPDFYRIGASSTIFHSSNSKSSSTSRQGALPTTDSYNALMGSECLTYMDVGSWPLFYVDYVDATKAKFLELDAMEPIMEANEVSPILKHVTPIPADTNRTTTFSGMPERYNYHWDSTATSFPENNILVKEVPIHIPPNMVEVAPTNTKVELTEEEMKTLLLDLVDKISRKADGYGFFSRPVNPAEDQCPDYFEIVDKVHEAMDVGTVRRMVVDSEISTLDNLEQYLNRIVLSSRKYNTDEENFVRKQTERFDLIAKSLVQKAKCSLGYPDIARDNTSSSSALSSTLMTAPYCTNMAVEKPLPPIFMRQRGSLSSDRCFDYISGRKNPSNQKKEPSPFSADNNKESNNPTSELALDHASDTSEHYNVSPIKKPWRQQSFPFKRKYCNISSDSNPQIQQQHQDCTVHSKKRDSSMIKSLESLVAGNELLAFVSNSSHRNNEISDDDEDNYKNSDHIADVTMDVAGGGIDDTPVTCVEINSDQQSGARRSKRTRVRTTDLQKDVGSAFDSLPHVRAARKIEDLNSNSVRSKVFPSCYGALSISYKLHILQFLLDELMQVDHIEAELNKRHDITRCFQPLEYAPLPSKEEMDRLSNVDDCALCNYPGDLVCCDGCPNSFHKRCCCYVDSPPSLSKQPKDSIDEEKWLCPECFVQDSSKLGNLHGGRKPSLYWWKKDDLERSFQVPPPTTSTDLPLCQVIQNPDVPDADIFSKSFCLKGSPEVISDKEYLIIHGFVFQRPTTRETEPVLLNQVELLDLLRCLGPVICSEWPWSQVPVNPIEIWSELVNSPNDKIKATLQQFHFLHNNYLTSQASFNPTLYKNMYKFAPPTPAYLQHQPIPKHLYQAVSPGELFVANYDQLVSSCLLAGVIEDENSSGTVMKVDLPIHSEVTADVYNDPIMMIYDKLLSLTDPLKPVKDYLISLERVLFRACLLHESWGMKWNKCKDRRIASIFSYRESNEKVQRSANISNSSVVLSVNVSWGFHLFHAQTVAEVCKCAVRLIDAVETRAFHEEWNKIPHKGSATFCSDADAAALRTNIDLPEHWTTENVILKRKWERSSDLAESHIVSLGERDNAARNFFLSSGRKGRKRPKIKETEHKVTAQSRAPSDNDSKNLDTCNLPALKPDNAAPRRGRPSKSSNRSFVTKINAVREFKLLCVHCENILPYTLSLNGVQHSTKDFFSHIQDCPSCPDRIKIETALLRSQKERSLDGPSFYKLLLGRARIFLSRDGRVFFRSSDVQVVNGKGSDLDCSSYSVTIQENESEELPSKELHGHILNRSGSVVDRSTSLHLTSGAEKTQEDPASSVNNSSMKQLSISNADHALNGTTNYTAEVPSKAVEAQHADAEECDGSAILHINARFTKESPLQCSTANSWQSTSRDTSIDQSKELLISDFSPNKCVLVDSTDARVASKYIVALYKNFIPSSMVQVPFKKPRVADCVNIDRYSASAPRNRGQRGVSERFFVGCAYCGCIPSLGIKVGGPQHAAKDLYYHLCDCKKCPVIVKALVGKLRSMGLKSHDSSKYFKLQLSRLAQHVNSRNDSQLRAELLYQVTEREGDLGISPDLSSEQCIYNFENSIYPLVKKEDEYIGSSYFSALYKHFWPVGKNFGNKRDNDSDVSLVFSASHKSMVWQSAASNDVTAELGSDKGSLEEIEDDFHPDEETIVVVTEPLDEYRFGKIKGKHATFRKTIFCDESKEQGRTAKQVKEDLKNDVRGEASDVVSKCSQIPVKDHIIYCEAAHRSDSGQQMTNDTGFDESNWPHATPESDVFTSITEVAEKATFKESKNPMVTKATMVDQREYEKHITDEDSTKLDYQQAIQEGGATGMENLREECAENNTVCEMRLDRNIFQASDSEADLMMKSNSKTEIEPSADLACCQAIVQVSDGGDEIQEDISEGDLDSARKDGRAVRRSGRVQVLRNSVQEKLGSYAEKTMTALESVYKWVTNAAEEEAMQKIRTIRMANLEKLLAEPFEKEIFWPICGRLYIPPAGSLSPATMRYLGRNGGSRVAPFMFYSEKLEVGQPSVRQRWRTNTLECESIEELHLQFQILEHHLNRTAINSCEQIIKRLSSKNSQHRIGCSLRDAPSGLIEYFVVNSSKNRGCWLPEDAIDLQSFVVMKRDRIERAKIKIESVAKNGCFEGSLKKEIKSTDTKEKIPESLGGPSTIPQKDPVGTKNLLDQATVSDATASEVLEDHFMSKLKNFLSKHHADALTLFETIHDADAQLQKMNKIRQQNRKLIDSVNATLKQMGSKIWMADDLISSKMVEAEHFAKQKVEEKLSFQQPGNGIIPYGVMNRQVVTDAEMLLEEAYMKHQRETKNLLAVSAEAGLKTVPEDTMNTVRADNLRSMQSANAALIKAKSPKAWMELDIVQKLKNAEALAIQWHISERCIKQHTKSPTPNQHSLPEANRVAQQYTGYYSFPNSTFSEQVQPSVLSRHPQDKQSYQAFVHSSSHQLGQMNRPIPQSRPQHFDHQAFEAPPSFSSPFDSQQTPAAQVYAHYQNHPQSHGFSHHFLPNSNHMHQMNLATTIPVRRSRDNYVVPSHNVLQQQQHQRRFQQMQLQQQGMILGNATILQQQQPSTQQPYLLMQSRTPMLHPSSEYPSSSYPG